jgi:hypothetical protein
MVTGRSGSTRALRSGASSHAPILALLLAAGCIDAEGSLEPSAADTGSHEPGAHDTDLLLSQTSTTHSSVPEWVPIRSSAEAPLEVLLLDPRERVLETRVPVPQWGSWELGVVVGYDDARRYLAITLDDQGKVRARSSSSEPSEVDAPDRELGVVPPADLGGDVWWKVEQQPDGMTLVRIGELEVAVAADTSARLGLVRSR